VIDDGRSQHVIGQGGQHFSVDGLDPRHQPVAADTRPAFPVRGASIKLRPLGAVIPRVGQPSPATDRTPGHPGQQILRCDLGFVSKRWTKVIAASPVSPPVSPAATGLTFTIDVVNVGTGLAVLVRGADFTLVYDAGSNDDLAIGANNRMLAFIRQVAPTLTTLDHVILSHSHQDHVVLLPDLFGAYEVHEAWDSGAVNDICGYDAFIAAVRDEAGVRYYSALQACAHGTMRSRKSAAQPCLSKPSICPKTVGSTPTRRSPLARGPP